MLDDLHTLDSSSPIRVDCRFPGDRGRKEGLIVSLEYRERDRATAIVRVIVSDWTTALACGNQARSHSSSYLSNLSFAFAFLLSLASSLLLACSRLPGVRRVRWEFYSDARMKQLGCSRAPR